MNPLSGPAGGGIPAWIPPLAGPEGTPRLCPVPTQLHHPLPQPMEGQGAQQTQAAAGGVRIEQEEKDSCPRANPKPPPCSVLWCGVTSHGTASAPIHVSIFRI